MENKINISELLRDCPQGMELDCTLWDNVTFDRVADGGIWIKHIDSKSGERSLYVYNDGSFPIHNLGSFRTKCVIFPKGKTTWEGFTPPCQFKDGDIVFYNNCVSIFKEWGDETLFRNYVKVDIDGRHPMLCDKTHSNGKGIKREARFATEEEKQKLFDAIKAKGYCWNPETKKLEKLIESKEDTDDGLVMSKEDRHDEIVMSGIYFDREYYADEVELHLGNYEIEVRDGKTYAVFKNQETKISKPNFKVENKIKKKSLDIVNPIEITSVIPKMYNTFKDGSFQHVEIIDEDYELALDKFDITTLKPFESRVLVRDDSCYEWEADIFGRYSDGYITLGGGKWKQCIPFEGNEHLLGTTDDCDEFFKF